MSLPRERGPVVGAPGVVLGVAGVVLRCLLPSPLHVLVAPHMPPRGAACARSKYPTSPRVVRGYPPPPRYTHTSTGQTSMCSLLSTVTLASLAKAVILSRRSLSSSSFWAAFLIPAEEAMKGVGVGGGGRASFEQGGGGGEGVLDPKLGVPKMA